LITSLENFPQISQTTKIVFLEGEDTAIIANKKISDLKFKIDEKKLFKNSHKEEEEEKVDPESPDFNIEKKGSPPERTRTLSKAITIRDDFE
jgi:hypothetical protein